MRPSDAASDRAIIAPSSSFPNDERQPRGTLLHRGTILRAVDDTYVDVKLERALLPSHMARNGECRLRWDELLPWTGYAARVTSWAAASTPEDSHGPLDDIPTIAIWRCELSCEGLFSALFWALGFIENGLCRCGLPDEVDHVLIDLSLIHI